MIRLVGLIFATLSGFALHAQNPEVSRSLTNAEKLTDAIGDGGDLNALGIDQLLDNLELNELQNLAGCTSETQQDGNKNLILIDWVCEGKVGSNSGDRTVDLRFTDEGLLFSLAINPARSIYGPTSHALKAVDLPKMEKTAERFARAIERGDDPTLAGLVPLTELQGHQLAKIVGFESQIKKPVSAAMKRAIRRAFGPSANIYEPPHNGFDINFTPTLAPDQKPLMVTIYFDDANRPIGVHIERSLLATTSIPKQVQ